MTIALSELLIKFETLLAGLRFLCFHSRLGGRERRFRRSSVNCPVMLLVPALDLRSPILLLLLELLACVDLIQELNVHIA